MATSTIRLLEILRVAWRKNSFSLTVIVLPVIRKRFLRHQRRLSYLKELRSSCQIKKLNRQIWHAAAFTEGKVLILKGPAIGTVVARVPGLNGKTICRRWFGRLRGCVMDLIEIVHLRSYSQSAGEEAALAFRHLTRYGREKGLRDIMLFRETSVPGALSIMIRWRGDLTFRGKSPLGLQLASAFSEFGQIDHSLWEYDSSLPVGKTKTHQTGGSPGPRRNPNGTRSNREGLWRGK